VLFFDKNKEKYLVERMKEKFHTFQGNLILDIASICDPIVRFVMKSLACNLLRKCRKDHVPTIMITTTKICVEGIHMNWEMFLLNQFFIYFEEERDKGTEFHYAWLLILIVLPAWREPYDTQFLGAKENPCLLMHYQNLCHTTHKA